MHTLVTSNNLIHTQHNKCTELKLACASTTCSAFQSLRQGKVHCYILCARKQILMVTEITYSNRDYKL